jgi:hypothetical protein
VTDSQSNTKVKAHHATTELALPVDGLAANKQTRYQNQFLTSARLSIGWKYSNLYSPTMGNLITSRLHAVMKFVKKAVVRGTEC